MKNSLTAAILITITFVTSVFMCPFLFETSNKYAQYTSSDPGLTNIGYAPFNLTANNFNCDGFFESTKSLKELHIAFLYNTFGNDFSCLERLLQDDRLKTLEINLINEPGHRNNRLGKYEFLYGVGSVRKFDSLMRNRDPNLRKKFLQYVTPLKEFILPRLRPQTSLLINPGLESNLSDVGGRVLVQWSRDEFPDSRIVWNPLRASNKRRKNTRADFIEGHGLFPKISSPCVYNLDGTDVAYPHRPALGQLSYQEGQNKNWIQSGPPLRQLLEQYANACEVVFLWTAESNGLDYKAGGFVDPRRRKNNIPTSMYVTIMRDVRYMHLKGKIYPAVYSYTEEDNYPAAFCDQVKTVFEDGTKDGNLLKQSEFRDRGGVILLNKEFTSVNKIEIVRGRNVVDVYNNEGPYHDGRPMFRSNTSPTKYPLKTYMTFLHHGKKICYKIPNPRVRLD